VGRHGYDGATRIERRGHRYVLGRIPDGYAIWDAGLRGRPIRTYPSTEQGMTEAWDAFRRLEGGAPVYQGQSWTNPQALWVRGQPIILGPMRLGHILDGAFRLYRMRFGTFLVVVALVALPYQALVLAMTLSSLEPVMVLPGLTIQQPAAWVSFVSLPIQFLFVAPFLTATVVKAAAETILGHASTVGSTLRAALPKLHSILWVTALVGLAGVVLYLPGIVLILAGAFASPPNVSALGLGLILLLAVISPALILFARFSFAPAVVMVEDLHGIAALRRSWQLVRGLTKKVLGTNVVAGLMVGVLPFIVGLIFLVIAIMSLRDASGTGGLGPGFYGARQAVYALIAILTTPFITLVGVLLYFDARVRKESFDLTLMAKQIGTGASDR
jgi:hypothetical protein